MKKNVVCSLGLSVAAGLTMSAFADVGFSTALTVPAASNPAATAAVDFNGDGALDLVVTVDGPDRVLLLRNTGAGFALAGSVLLGAGVGAEDIAVADFNGDGVMDLAITEHNAGRIQILPGAAGSFTLGVAIPSGAGSRSVRVADMNADGRKDLITANRDGDSVTVAINGVAGWTSAVYAVGEEPRTVATIDADGNGVLDLLVTNHRTRNATLLRNNGAGVMSPWATINTGAGMRPDGLEAWDFNGDGRTDFAVTQDNNGVGLLSVFLGQGAGAFAGPVHYATGGLNPGDLIMRDFDLDGDIDAATANQDSANVSILTNNGAGAFVATGLLAAGTDPDGFAAADFNGDGKFDLSVANRGSDTVSVFTNTTPGVCKIDFNRDGFVDFFDYTDFVIAFESGLPSADFNADGFLDFFDYGDFVAAFETGC
jgi:hypothetical protein